DFCKRSMLLAPLLFERLRLPGIVALIIAGVIVGHQRSQFAATGRYFCFVRYSRIAVFNVFSGTRN
ncbi:hypothetical protein, partial [Microcoleus sp.]|uniref:hypothetical protein n=1 Tax=Microcoleus sp. TaxID=44472 RepID=UPI00403E7A28